MKTNFKRLASMVLVMAMMVGMFAFGALTVGAAVEYDAVEEKITGIADGSFYTLKYDESKVDKAKWFPVIGGELDVSKLIPKKSDVKYTVGIVLATNYKGAATEKANVTSVQFSGRGEAPKKDDNKLETDNTIKLATTSEWRLGLGAWQKESALIPAFFAAAQNFPFGAVMEVRTAATTTAAASLKVVKIKIAAQPKAPNVSWDAAKGVKGWKADKMEFSKTADFTALETAPTANTAEGWAAYAGTTIYIRTAAAGKKPYSVSKSVEIPAATTTPDPDPEP